LYTTYDQNLQSFAFLIPTRNIIERKGANTFYINTGFPFPCISAQSITIVKVHLLGYLQRGRNRRRIQSFFVGCSIVPRSSSCRKDCCKNHSAQVIAFHPYSLSSPYINRFSPSSLHSPRRPDAVAAFVSPPSPSPMPSSFPRAMTLPSFVDPAPTSPPPSPLPYRHVIREIHGILTVAFHHPALPAHLRPLCPYDHYHRLGKVRYVHLICKPHCYTTLRSISMSSAFTPSEFVRTF
jgi:hypothetical protein